MTTRALALDLDGTLLRPDDTISERDRRAVAAAAAFGGVAGWFFERVIVKPVYKDHLRQILITIGALIVAEQLILAIWGGVPIQVQRPASNGVTSFTR